MSFDGITQAEAERLIKMLKKAYDELFYLPEHGKNQFVVVGDTQKDKFTIQFYRGEINAEKYSINALVNKNNTTLLRLDIVPPTSDKKHRNPGQDELITGSHWHIYREGYGDKFAYPAKDISGEDFYDHSLEFFKKFNIIKAPKLVMTTILNDFIKEDDESGD